jgi:hypothetical protein
MAMKSGMTATIFFLFAALAGGCSILFQSTVMEYVDFSTLHRWLFDWMFLLWISGFILCLLLLGLGITRLKNDRFGKSDH